MEHWPAQAEPAAAPVNENVESAPTEPSNAVLTQMATRQEIAAAPVPDDLPHQVQPETPVQQDENETPFEAQPAPIEQEPFVVRTLQNNPVPEENNMQNNVPPAADIVPNNTNIVQPQTSAPSNPVIPSIMPPPEVMQWLQTVPSWPDDNPFPVTELDSNNYDELMQAGFQRMREAYALFTKAYGLKP